MMFKYRHKLIYFVQLLIAEKFLILIKTTLITYSNFFTSNQIIRITSTFTKTTFGQT